MSDFDLCWLPALELAALIRDKQVSPVEVADAVLARIESVNPRFGAFCAVAADDAREAAAAAEVAVMTGEVLGALHGVPVSVKDLVFTRRLVTAGGSRLFADHVPEEDAVCVERLRGAGAILVGKTTTPEFGHKAVTESPLCGITRNPSGPGAHPGRVQRRIRRWPWPPASARSPSAPTPAAPSVSRPRSAGCTASSPRSGASRSPPDLRAGKRSRIPGPSRAPCATPRSRWT